MRTVKAVRKLSKKTCLQAEEHQISCFINLTYLLRKVMTHQNCSRILILDALMIPLVIQKKVMGFFEYNNLLNTIQQRHNSQMEESDLIPILKWNQVSLLYVCAIIHTTTKANPSFSILGQIICLKSCYVFVRLIYQQPIKFFCCSIEQ